MFGLSALTGFILSLLSQISRPTNRQYGLRFSGRTFQIIPCQSKIINGKTTIIEDKPLVNSWVSTIQSVFSLDATETAFIPSPDHDYWQVVIQAKKTHTLPWKLSKSESEWIVQEINNWRDRAYQGQND
jgi:hypothetical protein